MIVAVAVLVGLNVAHAPAFRSWEESGLDFLFKIRTDVPEQIPVVVVMVDEKAYEKDFGYYDPLPRRYLARLIDTLKAKGAKTIALDIAFYDKLDQLDARGDTLLRDAMRRARNVVSVSIWHQREDGSIRIQEPDPFFRPALQAVGYANLQISGGGGLASVREVRPVATMSDNTMLLSFSAAAYCQMMDLPAEEFIRDIRENRWQLLPRIPRDAQGNMLINYISAPSEWVKQEDGTWTQMTPSRITTYRSSQLTGDIEWPEDIFKDKLIVVGNGSEFVPDRFITPFFEQTRRNWMYGAEVHANAFLTLLNKSFIDKPGWPVIALCMLLLSITMVMATVRLGFAAEMATLTVLLITVWTGAHILFAGGWWIPAVSLSLVVLLSYFMTSIFQAFTEEHDKKQIKGMFSRYAPPAYVDQLVLDPSKLELGGEEKEISILFSDIEGFTSISETMAPKQLVELLNDYLNAMTQRIFQQGGTLDKYIGDAIVAVFGAPLPQNEHALHACYAALDMQSSLEEFRAKWMAKGMPAIRNRIGVNTGRVVFGNIGSDIRYDYTGIGDAMNLASRLEAANKQYGTYLMISEFTHAQVRERVIVRELDMIVVKGKTKPVKVYELLGRANEPLPENTRHLLARYQEGIDLYHKREWSEAIRRFEQALTYAHTDEPSKLYIHRCKQFIAEPPAPDWDGTYHLTSK